MLQKLFSYFHSTITFLSFLRKNHAATVRTTTSHAAACYYEHPAKCWTPGLPSCSPSTRFGFKLVIFPRCHIFLIYGNSALCALVSYD
ncbi:unnamed protein product [Oikopleura dioica]|uniref:Uncharacterized protein n=1 Tax=Oikopleura dioica TaxID=34765 RepID=E4X2U3_OIKDI|nr:unnamed protein product [Oikopleura dioica]